PRVVSAGSPQDGAAASIASSQLWSNSGGDSSDLPARFFSISLPDAADLAAIDLQSARSSAHTGGQPTGSRLAHPGARQLFAFAFDGFNSHDAGLHRGDSNSHR